MRHDELEIALSNLSDRCNPSTPILELSGAGVRIPHCFPTGFTLGSVLRITLQEMKRLPLREEA